jgi:hypothetical protein
LSIGDSPQAADYTDNRVFSGLPVTHPQSVPQLAMDFPAGLSGKRAVTGREFFFVFGRRPIIW